jgi:hypothetical protein
VHSTFLRHQQQCSAPLNFVPVFHGKAALRLAGGSLDDRTAARPTSSPAACGLLLPPEGYARTGLSIVEQTAVQLGNLGVAGARSCGVRKGDDACLSSEPW